MGATELAVCLPVIVLIALATVEATAMIFLQQSLSIAAYEGARVALAAESEEANVRYQSELILTARGVRGATVGVMPADFPSLLQGEWIQVEASAPFSENSFVGGWLFSGRTLTASVAMMKE